MGDSNSQSAPGAMSVDEFCRWARIGRTSTYTFARACRKGQANDLLASVGASAGTSLAVACQRIALLLRIAPELFAFYTTLWHLAALGDLP